MGDHFPRDHSISSTHSLSGFIRSTVIYTQSQKKRTMNSLASAVTQGQGQVIPAGSYFITIIWNRSQKTPFKNVKRFPRYLEKSKGMLCFGIRKTAQIPLGVMQIWYFFKTLHFFWPRVHGIESCGIFYFGSVVTKSLGKMKYTTKFIYLHSFAKDTQLSTVRFFWDWV